MGQVRRALGERSHETGELAAHPRLVIGECAQLVAHRCEGSFDRGHIVRVRIGCVRVGHSLAGRGRDEALAQFVQVAGSILLNRFQPIALLAQCGHGLAHIAQPIAQLAPFGVVRLADVAQPVALAHDGFLFPFGGLYLGLVPGDATLQIGQLLGVPARAAFEFGARGLQRTHSAAQPVLGVA